MSNMFCTCLSSVGSFQMVWHLNQQHFGENCHCAKAAWPKNDAAQNAASLVGSEPCSKCNWISFAFNCPHQSLLTRLSVSNLSPNDLLGVYQKCMGKIRNCRCCNRRRVFYQQCKGLMVETIQGPTYKSASTSASNPHFEFSLTHSQCHTQELLNANNLGTWVISETCLALCSEREWDSPFW